MTKQEIHDAVVRLGYRFKSKDPFNVLGVVLYGKKPRFRNEGGRFSPEGSPASWAANNGRRGMSEEGRARIAAAQRARWAKQKGPDGARKAKRRMSAEGRARIAAAARARWARERAKAG
jgi:hypothetical protein